METKLCNGCENLAKELVYGKKDVYTAVCKKFKVKTSVGEKERSITFRMYENDEVQTPVWCPLREENKNKPCVNDLTKYIKSKVTSVTNAVRSVVTPTKVEPKLDIEPMTAWEAIEKEGVYVIPPVFGKKRRLVYVKEVKEEEVVVDVLLEDGSSVKKDETYKKDSAEAKLMVKLNKY